MSILAHILKQLIHPSRPTQQHFLGLLFTLWLAIPGRINFLNLARYSGKSEKTFRNWFEKPLDWLSLNTALIQHLQHGNLIGKRAILGIDASFIPKAGNSTPGLGKFWNGSIGRAEQGLELSCCTYIDLEHRQAFVLHACQTPTTLEQGKSRLGHYADHASDVLGSLPPAVRDSLEAVVGDAYYSKKTFVDAMIARGITVVGKLRLDADLHYLYVGPPSQKVGRPRLYDGKVDFKDFQRWEPVTFDFVGTGYSAIVYSKSLKRNIRVVVILWPRKSGMGRGVFYSTDTMMPAQKVMECYRARFEMEFPFRDAKQHGGLLSCQSRQSAALEFHWNMSFLSVNLTRAEQLEGHVGAKENFVFRMEDAKRRAYNEVLAQRIFEVLPLRGTWDKFRNRISDVLNLGVKMA